VCRAAIVAAVLLLDPWTGGATAQLPASPHFTLERIADGVYAAIHKTGGSAICNAGIINLGSATIIFDTFLTPAAARDLRAAAETLTSSPIRYVINSHFHNDHIRGNQVFRPGADIISTTGTLAAIATEEPRQLAEEQHEAPQQLADITAALARETDAKKKNDLLTWQAYFRALAESHDSVVTTLPTISVEGRMVLHGSHRTVELIALEKGHTGSDLILYLPNEKIVFTGDIVSAQTHPWLGDGFPETWIADLGQLLAMPVETVVSGHGPVGDIEDISTMIRYIQTTDRLARTALAARKSEKDLASISIPPEYAGWALGRFFAENLRFLYNRAKASTRGK
jgi:glyoxylase-like metal-dependent hydrolase (beta-lactamase superfamily II)